MQSEWAGKQCFCQSWVFSIRWIQDDMHRVYKIFDADEPICRRSRFTPFDSMHHNLHFEYAMLLYVPQLHSILRAFFFVCSSCDVKWYLKPGINMSCSWAENKSSRQWEKTQQQHRVKKNNGSNNDNINDDDDCSVRRRRASPPSNIVCTLLAFNTTNTECVQSVLHGFVKCFTPF